MTTDERKKLYAALAAPFAEACIERTDGKVTGRGYSTTGIGYQWIVNRLNEVLGVGGFRAHRTMSIAAITRANGRPAFEAICDLTLELGTWEGGEFVVFAESLADGGHVSTSEADARKGAFTNAFKKAAAFHGVGKQAYEGTLDDDSVPVEPTPQPSSPVKRDEPTPSVTPRAADRSPPAKSPGSERNRITSRQHAAVFSIARKAGIELSSLRSQVKAQYQKQLEFLSREEASQLIDALNRKLSGNGSAQAAAEPAQQGAH